MVNNRNEAQALHDGLHKTYNPREEGTSGYKGGGRGYGKKRPPLRRAKP